MAPLARPSTSRPPRRAAARPRRRTRRRRPRYAVMRLEEEQLAWPQSLEHAAAWPPEVDLAEQVRPVREQPVPAALRHPDKSHRMLVLCSPTVRGRMTRAGQRICTGQLLRLQSVRSMHNGIFCHIPILWRMRGEVQPPGTVAAGSNRIGAVCKTAASKQGHTEHSDSIYYPNPTGHVIKVTTRAGTRPWRRVPPSVLGATRNREQRCSAANRSLDVVVPVGTEVCESGCSVG